MVKNLIRGIDLDAAGRCKHYHKDVDIAALNVVNAMNIMLVINAMIVWKIINL